MQKPEALVLFPTLGQNRGEFQLMLKNLAPSNINRSFCVNAIGIIAKYLSISHIAAKGW